MDWRQILLLPVTLPLHLYRLVESERTTRRYLEDVSPDSCLIDLREALSPLLDGISIHVDSVFTDFATTNFSGGKYWNIDNFRRYINLKLPSNHLVDGCAPLLWRIFCAAAYYPFSSSQVQLSGLGDSAVDIEAFKRAFGLLATRGFDILGAKQDGLPLSRNCKLEQTEADKMPRLTRVIWRCLVIPSAESCPDSMETLEGLQLQDVKDTITLSQPETYDADTFGRSIDEEVFETTARRLLRAEDGSIFQKQPTTLPKADLEALIRLLLTSKIGNKRWREGLFMNKMHQRSSDVQYGRLVDDFEETARVSDFATAFMASNFAADEDFIPWNVFQTFCARHVRLAFQLY